MSSSVAIELAGIKKRYGDVAVVDGIDIQVHRGECLALVGQNGAGKTTVMKLMLGLIEPSGGQVTVLDTDPTSRVFTARRGRLGYLPENVSFYQHMTGLELLRYYARLKGVADEEVGRRLLQVGLHEAAGERIKTFSKGMRQRLGLAQAILGDPELLFLDEPTTGFDPMVRRDFYQIISNLRTNGTTVVISSHSFTDVEVLADRIALLRNGRLVACGSLPDLSKEAGLPLRARITVKPDCTARVAQVLAPHRQFEQINDRTIDLIYVATETVSTLQQIASLGDMVLDVSISTTRLEDVYLHLMSSDP